MSYLKYSGLAADMVRESLKEPFKSKAKLREAVYFKAALWKDGQQQQQGEQLMQKTSGFFFALLSWYGCC